MTYNITQTLDVGTFRNKKDASKSTGVPILYIVAGIAGALLLLGLAGGVIYYKTRTSQVNFFSVSDLSITLCGRETTFSHHD